MLHTTARYRIFIHLIGIISILLILSSASFAGERLVIQLKDFTKTEIKCGGFILPKDQSVHVYSLGGGNRKSSFSNSDMYAYGWIINADSREVVWQMERSNTRSQDNFRKFDDDIFLKKGSYEIYFAGYAYGGSSVFSNFNLNIDRRKPSEGDKYYNRGFFNWLEEMFSDDYERDWKKIAKNWEISLFVDSNSDEITTFNVPKEFQNILFKATHLGEDVHIRQRFLLNKEFPIQIYAIGEKDNNRTFADYGWIINVKTRQRIWDFEKSGYNQAGGADKNVLFNETINFPAGEYLLYYVTDDSHSFLDWNSAPPADPFNYGITLFTKNGVDKDQFKLLQASEEKNIIAQIVKVTDDESRSTTFTLKEETPVRIYALGERSNNGRDMADFGWIINTKTREKVWTMEEEETEHAGGADKNRMVDQIITLPKGTYTVFYQTDDSHGYNDWNLSAPFDPEHWGITIYGEGESFNMSNVEKNVSQRESGVIAQIVMAGDNANKTERFSLDKSTRVRIYAIGEGQNREMYDYGWIENASTGNVVWEMTYSMTFHAGGGRKNRSVNTTITLDKGNYILHYESDDSHSYGDWNTTPPDDPTMWGITLYDAEK
ncbi:MAG: hypothetical protein HY964_03005 [Ignavibacteriales bacterium]|nr:hypothetical protein [Ignavibacteriales bacterium]